MTKNKRDVHVVPNKSTGRLNWSVKREGAKRASSTHENKTDAMSSAKHIAQNNKLERVEHNKFGVITGSDSYGNDPTRTRG